jgi:hypothetical protein
MQNQKDRIIRHTRANLGAVFAGAVVLALASLAPVAAATPAPVVPPFIPDAAPLPGLLAPASTTAPNIGLLTTKPDVGPVGTKFTLSGQGLAPNKPVSLVWGTANVTWILDARPDTVDYLGKQSSNVNVVLGTAQTDSKGTFTTQLTVPRDWGGVHDIYAVVDGVQVAHGGFQLARTVTITPKSGPIGTPITIKVSGLGSSLYGSSTSVYYDNHYTGVMTGTWSRGEATTHIHAAGPLGKHAVVVAGGMQFNYLNYQQSPIPWATGGQAVFTVTKDNGPPKPVTVWPLTVQPTVDARTTVSAISSTSGSAQMRLDSTSGTVLSAVNVTATGLAASTSSQLMWSTVVGNRVNCTGTCWTFQQVPLGTVTTGADGSLQSKVQIPDGLGGWHVIQVVQSGKIQAQVPYYVKRSLVGFPKVVKAGSTFQVHLKGVGWTQLDNTVAVDYDNSYVGYGCGFNSNGDVVVNLVATGGPGTHLIDIYPLLYTYSPAYPYPPHGMIPFLSFQRDEPGLALGYQLPAFRLAIKVV